MEQRNYSWEEQKEEYFNLEDQLSAARAVDRVRLIVERFGEDAVTLLTSFGVQSGVMLSLVAEACPNVRVLYIHTQGPTSERDLEYGRALLETLGLDNFTMAKAHVTRDEFQAGMAEVGITLDSKIKGQLVFHTLSQDVFKITPLKRECEASGTMCLLSGVRRGQTADRDKFDFLQYTEGHPAKAHPILDWTDEQCLEYLRFKNVPAHPELDSLLRVMRAPEAKGPDSARNTAYRRSSSLLRSVRPERAQGAECGIHVQTDGGGGNSSSGGKVPVPAIPNMVIGRLKCRFCIAAKELLSDSGVEYAEAPAHLFPHLIPPGTRTVPVVYLDRKLVGGYGDLCAHLGVEDTLNGAAR